MLIQKIRSTGCIGDEFFPVGVVVEAKPRGAHGFEVFLPIYWYCSKRNWVKVEEDDKDLFY